MTSWGTPSGRSPVRRPASAAERRRRRPAPGPWRTPCRRGRRPRRRRRPSNAPVDRDDAGRQQRPVALDRAPGGRRRRRRPCPTSPTANAIHSLRAGRRRSRGCTTVPTPGAPATASASTPGRSARGDDRPHARPGRDLGRGDLRGHAAAPPRRCRRRRPAPRARGRPRRSPRSATPTGRGGGRR